MTAIDTIRPAGHTASARRIGGIFVAAFGAVAAWDDARRTRHSLEALSDHELDDIGLTRGDIERMANR